MDMRCRYRCNQPADANKPLGPQPVRLLKQDVSTRHAVTDGPSGEPGEARPAGHNRGAGYRKEAVFA